MPQTVASHVIAADLAVPDRDRWWDAATSRASGLRGLGAHHLVAYAALQDPARLFVTIGVRHREPLDRVLRSRAVFDWFDATGVEQIPPLFAGSVVEKIAVEPDGHDAARAGDARDRGDRRGDHHGDHHGAVVVAAITEVADVELLRAHVHSDVGGFRAAGVRKVWIYRALDVGREVMVLQEVASEGQVHPWLDHSDAALDWMGSTGLGVYPPLFVGRLLRAVHLDPDVAAQPPAEPPTEER